MNRTVASRRHAVGAHYGLMDWLIQRLSAVVMIVYTVFVLGIVLWIGGLDYDGFRGLFAFPGFRHASFLFMAALLYHAWIGVREILMDYVHPVGLRLALQAAFVALLVGYLGWTIQILWGQP